MATGAAGLSSAGTLDTGVAQHRPATTFTVRVENVSDDSTLTTTLDGDDAEQPVPLSPGAYAVHRQGEPIFSRGEPERNNGLEEIAEDGNPERLSESLADDDLVSESDVFDTPVEGDEAGPIGPDEAYEFSVTAQHPSMFLSLVTMFVPSNDLYYAVGGATGVRLFERGSPVSGTLTVGLWDAGTEINEEPGVGENQVQRQRGPGVGLVERGTVAPIDAVNGYEYPDPSEVIEVTVTPEETTTTATPEPETPEAETPEAETPEAETPEAETPEAETPEAETPEAETPEAETPEAETPEAETTTEVITSPPP
ncbi:spondin domain-containing protein [Haloarculaceae archaeon H-GB11]|nr:spondin domain-containing protein [Haloarculaceae archaeon H-GB11]